MVSTRALGVKPSSCQWGLGKCSRPPVSIRLTCRLNGCRIRIESPCPTSMNCTAPCNGNRMLRIKHPYANTNNRRYRRVGVRNNHKLSKLSPHAQMAFGWPNTSNPGQWLTQSSHVWKLTNSHSQLLAIPGTWVPKIAPIMVTGNNNQLKSGATIKLTANDNACHWAVATNNTGKLITWIHTANFQDGMLGIKINSRAKP